MKRRKFFFRWEGEKPTQDRAMRADLAARLIRLWRQDRARFVWTRRVGLHAIEVKHLDGQVGELSWIDIPEDKPRIGRPPKVARCRSCGEMDERRFSAGYKALCSDCRSYNERLRYWHRRGEHLDRPLV
jgi:hypothetical protein